MIKFFRKIRERLMSEGKTSKYLLYAMGEILLVVIGILIAGSINNWNEDRKNRITEQQLLGELKENLTINLARLANDIEQEQKTIDAIDLVANHLDNRKQYHDSLDTYFDIAFFAPDIVLSTSAFESIRLKGVDIIQSDRLRKSIIELFDVSYANMISETVRLENQFWPVAVLPLKHKYFRFVDMTRIKPTDYQALLNDPIYKNTILDRKGFRIQAKGFKAGCLADTKATLALIDELLK